MFFLELPCFFDDPTDVDNLISDRLSLFPESIFCKGFVCPSDRKQYTELLKIATLLFKYRQNKSLRIEGNFSHVCLVNFGTLLDVFGFIQGYWGFPSGSVGKESACNAGDTEDQGLITGSGRSLGGGNGNPLQYSCLGNPWILAGYSSKGRKESDMLNPAEQLGTHKVIRLLYEAYIKF